MLWAEPACASPAKRDEGHCQQSSHRSSLASTVAVAVVLASQIARVVAAAAVVTVVAAVVALVPAEVIAARCVAVIESACGGRGAAIAAEREGEGQEERKELTTRKGGR